MTSIETTELHLVDQADQRTARGTSRAARHQAAIAAIALKPQDVQIGYVSRDLAMCNLPLRDQKGVREWTRRNGDITVRWSCSEDAPGLPFGGVARSLIEWLMARSMKAKGARFKVPTTMNELLREVGLDPETGGGKRGDAKRLTEQFNRLTKCRVSIEYVGKFAAIDGERFKEMEIAPNAELWFEHDRPGEECWIDLSPIFYEALTRSKIPIDSRATTALKRSSMSRDLYHFLSHRIGRLVAAGQKSTSIPLKSMQEQLGANYKEFRNFRAAMRTAMQLVKKVFPDLDFEVGLWTLGIKSSRPPVPIAPTGSTNKNTLGPNARAWFAKTFPRTSFESVKQTFREWIEEIGIDVENAEALFRKVAPQIVIGSSR